MFVISDEKPLFTYIKLKIYYLKCTFISYSIILANNFEFAFFYTEELSFLTIASCRVVEMPKQILGTSNF
jgi:hypothetical protein